MDSSSQKQVLTPVAALERYRDELCLHDAKGRLVMLPGVIGTVSFERGSKPDVRRGILACFDHFEQLFGEHLKGGRNGDGTGGFTRKTSDGLEAIRRTILEAPPEEQMEVVRSSATDQDTAAAFQIETLTNVATDEDYRTAGGAVVEKGRDRGLSYLKFWMPMDYVGAADGVRGYEAFLRFVCEQLPVRGGYGGLSSILPFSFHEYLPQEWTLAQRFSGLEIDSYAFLQKKECETMSYEGEFERKTALYDDLHPGAKVARYGFIKGVNWYTIIGDLFVDRLGGEVAVRAALARTDIGIERVGKCLLIRAGDFPRLGAPEEGLPEPYVFVNRVLRVLRNPYPEALHTNVPGAPSADAANTRAWEARFDLRGAPMIQHPPTVVPERADRQ